MSEEQFIRNIEIRLSAHAREVVMATRILAERRVDDIVAELRRDVPASD